MKKNKTDIMAWLMSGLFGVFSGMFLVFGYQLETFEALDLKDTNALMVLLAFMVILTIDTRYVWKNYEDAKWGGKLFGLIRLPDEPVETQVGRKDFLVNWSFMVLLSLPVLFAEFPGFFVYDAQEELNEVLTRTFTTHHPLLHVLILGGVVALFHKLTGSWNLGIFAYSVFQMLAITAIFAYVVTYLQKKGFGKKSRVLWILFYGVFRLL